MEAKILVFTVLKNFEIMVVDKTQIPLRLSPQFDMRPAGGLWVGLKTLTN